MTKELDYIAINRGSMEYIWKKLPKTTHQNIECARYLHEDIEFLYSSGLVDVGRVSKQEFENFFKNYRDKQDGAYYLNYDALIAMGQYRYHRIVSKPFDPLKMRSGKYSRERLLRVFENSIIPSTSLPEDLIKEQFKNICKNVDENGMVIVDETFKQNIARTLDAYPSPRRKLELDVANINEEKIDTMVKQSQKPMETFFTDKSDIKKIAVQGLNEIVLQAAPATDPHRQGGAPIDLKSLSKPKPGKV